MGKMFGGLIAKQLDAAFKSASSSLGGSLALSLTTYTQGTRTPGSINAGTNPTVTAYSARGFKDRGRRFYLASANVWIDVDVIAIFGNSLPSGVLPKPGDTITIDGAARKIVAVDDDPDAAVHSCQVR